jgi:integrase
MAARHKLSAAFVKTASAGKHGDGAGLWLVKRPDGGAQWMLRVAVHGRRREMGLGGLDKTSLKQARDLADHWRGVAATGLDPIKERARLAREQVRADNTLRKIAEEAFEARKAELKGDGKAGRWFSPLELHVLPRLGRIPVEKIDQRDIRDALAPIWHDKADTARKAMNRLGICLRHAAALGLDVDLQAPEKAKALLGKSRHKPTNIAAMHWADVPAFVATLQEPTVTHLALRLLILTGVRSGPLRHLRLDQIEGDIWTIPGDGMKGRRDRTGDFRVPLPGEALRVIALAAPFEREGYLFASMRKGVISDATMSRMMKRRGLKERPHGFRSRLRTWLAEATDAPHEVAETMLAHVSGTSVERAYRRTDLLEQRRALLERWANHVTGGDDRLVRMAEAR